MTLPVGTLIASRFVVDGPALGVGSSGIVWPATDRETGRSVAVKLLHPTAAGGAQDAAALARLQDEAAVAGRLRHPNIVEVLGLWSDPVHGWGLVTERVDGVALSAVGPLPAAAVVALGVQLVKALQLTWSAGLVHGDLRPGNVLLCTEGAKLFDFGVVRTMDREDLRPGETAPERFVGSPPSRAADIYGLGVVLCHALTGRIPFDGDTAWSIVGAQRRGAPSISLLAGSPPAPGLAKLISYLLRPDAAERPDLALVARSLRWLSQSPPWAFGSGRPGHRSMLWFRPTLPPLRVRSRWVVHGSDPTNGAPIWMARGLSRRRAKRLVRRMRAAGWHAETHSETFGSWDLVCIAILAGVGAFLVPAIGAPVGVALGAFWRSRNKRPHLADDLPQLSVALPTVQSDGAEVPVAIGLLLMLTAVLLAIWPVGSLVPLGLIVLLFLGKGLSKATAGALASQGRIRSAIADLRRRLDNAPDADHALLLTGQTDALEEDWLAGRVDDDRVLLTLDGLTAEARATVGGEALATSGVLEALRRVKRP